MIGKFSAKSRKIALCLLKSIGFLLNSSNTSSGSLNYNKTTILCVNKQ